MSKPAPNTETTEMVACLPLTAKERELLLFGMATLIDTTTEHAEPAEAMFAKIEALPVPRPGYFGRYEERVKGWLAAASEDQRRAIRGEPTLDAAEQRASSERNKALEEAAQLADMYADARESLALAALGDPNEDRGHREDYGHSIGQATARAVAKAIRALQNGGGDA